MGDHFKTLDPQITACNFPRAGLAMLGQIDERFVEVVDVMEPLASGSQDRAFISRGYDATSHFETTVRPGTIRQLPAVYHGLDASFKLLTRSMTSEVFRPCCLAVPTACCGGMQPVRDLAQRLKSVMDSK